MIEGEWGQAYERFETLYFVNFVMAEPKDTQITVLANALGHYFHESFGLQVQFLIEKRVSRPTLLLAIVL